MASVLDRYVTSTVLELLEAELSESALRDLERSCEGCVPAGLWQQALRQPLREFLSRPGKEFRARLVSFAWGVSGQREPIRPVLPLLVELIHAGSLIIDDIQDGSRSRRGGESLHQMVGTPIALNCGNWLYFWPLVLLERMELEPSIELQLHREFIGAMHRCHYGQSLDLGARIIDIPQREVSGLVRTITELKTGTLMRLATSVGAITAKVEPAVRTALAEFGRRLGIGLQMLNDLGNLLQSNNYEDLRHGRLTWLWGWLAEDLPKASYDQLIELCRHAAADPVHWVTLASMMREHLLRLHAAARVEEFLDEPMNELSQQFPGSEEISLLSEEIDRLKQSYLT